MKKTVLLFLTLTSVLCTTVLSVQAQAVRHQWYCKHVGGHVQPPLDQRLSFIEEHNAYYIDRCHTDADKDTISFSSLPISPIVARQTARTFLISPDGRRRVA